MRGAVEHRHRTRTHTHTNTHTHTHTHPHTHTHTQRERERERERESVTSEVFTIRACTTTIIFFMTARPCCHLTPRYTVSMLYGCGREPQGKTPESRTYRQ